jgi:hypothetical protein
MSRFGCALIGGASPLTSSALALYDQTYAALQLGLFTASPSKALL